MQDLRQNLHEQSKAVNSQEPSSPKNKMNEVNLQEHTQESVNQIIDV